jgi:hypothetical protein
MNRIASAALLLAALTGSSPAHAAARSCGGVAPVVRSCGFSVAATTTLVDGYFESSLFAGTAEYAIDGPHGSIRASCYAYPGVSTCFPVSQGSFQTGDPIDVTVHDVTGAGPWQLLLHY